MFLHRTRLTLLAVACVATWTSRSAAQTTPPDLSGTWQEDLDASKALTDKKGAVWRVAGANSGSGAAQPAVPKGATVMRPINTIKQSDSEIVFERRYEGESEVVSREVHKLDGSVSVNATRNSSSRSTTVWKGAALVTTGTTHLDFSDAHAVDANGRPITEITRQFVTTRTLMPDGTMQVESRSTQDGKQVVLWSVLVRVKPS